MRKNSPFIFLMIAIIISCSSNTTSRLPEFPLYKGTTWVYSYESYDPSPSDPREIIKATYQLTETIVDVESISTYLVADVKREYGLIKADNGWTGDLSSQPNEFWYVVNDNQVFQSNQPLDGDSIKLDELTFDYEFPLSVNKSWCLLPHNPQDSQEITGCDFIGKREVTKQGHYETPAGSFNDCYDMIDYFNGGDIFQKFCNGVGIVYMKFDHAETRFGFEQTLIDYSVGVP
ncbi:MAG: hypothetical protein L0287_02120 [Anaerolineae bacterium]|nr:hypothetical protein [Anaerolineae bacterium]